MTDIISKKILLTGAGFTYNFGGFLADRMWAEIFNHPTVQKSRSIRKIMLDDFNYESIYDQILSKKRISGKCFTQSAKKAITSAIFEAYKKLDNSVYDFLFSNRPRMKPELDVHLKRLIRAVVGEKNKINCFFTLNQDIFFERFYRTIEGKLGKKIINLPGPDIFVVPKNERQYELEEDDFITLKKDVDVNSIKKSLSKKEINYLKLHGSYNWLNSDGSNAMVIGLDKESHITREQLLHCYFDIFKEVLFRKNVNLLVIGYSFRDKHINQIIAESIENHNLKLFVLSPESPRDFAFNFDKPEYFHGDSILKGLTGYYPFKLNEESLKILNKLFS